MSTPSTATTIVHPHHYGSSHYAYVHSAHSAQPSPLEPTFASSARLPPTPSYSAFPQQSARLSSTARSNYYPEQSIAPNHTPQQTATPVMSRKRPSNAKQPDWHAFYKNGVPKEIIVIDDDSPEPLNGKQAGAETRPAYYVETDGPANKKRRTNQQYQAASLRDKPSYSNTNTPRYENSGSGTISTDRTTDVHTTAPTSLGSNDSGRGYVEAAQPGQKRKRVTRQQTGSDQQKKRRDEIAAEIKHDPYVPPNKVYRQKDDVQVRMVTDRPAHHPQAKFDDDDGHYIVTEQAYLTDRCKFDAFHLIR